MSHLVHFLNAELATAWARVHDLEAALAEAVQAQQKTHPRGCLCDPCYTNMTHAEQDAIKVEYRP